MVLRTSALPARMCAAVQAEGVQPPGVSTRAAGWWCADALWEHVQRLLCVATCFPSVLGMGVECYIEHSHPPWIWQPSTRCMYAAAAVVCAHTRQGCFAWCRVIAVSMDGADQHRTPICQNTCLKGWEWMRACAFSTVLQDAWEGWFGVAVGQRTRVPVAGMAAHVAVLFDVVCMGLEVCCARRGWIQGRAQSRSAAAMQRRE